MQRRLGAEEGRVGGRHEELDGCWSLVRRSGLLPPLGLLAKRIEGSRGTTRIGRLAEVPFRVRHRPDGPVLVYAGLGIFRDRLAPGPDGGWEGEATVLGRRFGRFAMRRAGRPRVVVVTGASSGVGRAVCRELGARGERVALLARGRVGLSAAAREVEAAGGRALALPVDVADAPAVDAAAARVEEELGPIDVWVNDAMTTVFAHVWETGPEEFRRATEVTYLGVVHGTMAALARMRPRDRGTIVQVGSALAFRGIPLQSAYCGAKHATAASPSRCAAS